MKKIISILTAALLIAAFGCQKKAIPVKDRYTQINIGSPDAGAGDNLYTAFTKVNANFAAVDDSLELKAPIANPNFTGVARLNTTDTLATQAYARAEGGGSSEGEGVWGGITGTLSDQTDLQSALNAKAPTVSPTFTTSATLPAATSIGTVSSTEISYLDNATSNIQAQLDDTVSVDHLFAGQFNILDYGAVSGDDLCDAEAIQDAVDAASAYDWGIVKIPSGSYDIADSITLKSGVVIDIDPNAFITVEADYEGPVFTTYGARVQDAWVKGGYFYGTTNTWNFVNLYGNDSYEAVINHFVDNKVYGAKYVINVDITTATGWANANQFHNQIVWNPVRYLSVSDAVSGGLGFDGNQFSNIVIQTNTDLDTAIFLCCDNNIFDNVYVWDLDSDQRSIVLTAYADNNYFMGSFGPSSAYWDDDGSHTYIINRGRKVPNFINLTYLSASAGITATYIYEKIYFNVGAARDITADPQIGDGPYDGFEITIIGSSDTHTLTLDDGTGLALAGGAQCVLGVGDAITLVYISDLDLWVETTRSNN